MKIEVMLYIYGAVCVSMILFNVVYNIFLKRREPDLKKRCQKIKMQLDIQFKNIKRSGKISERHIKYLIKKLKHTSYLTAFDLVLGEVGSDKLDIKGEYIHQIQPAVLYLAVYYLDKDNIKAGYFTYFLSRCEDRRRRSIDSLQDILLEYVKKDNLYCRCNALQALYNFANVEHVLKGLMIQDDGRVFVHEKILTEGLLSFTGDHGVLIDELWKNFNSFSVHTQLAILNYIRFKTGDYKEKMFAVMMDEKLDKELRLAGIRYFGKYYYAPALEKLISFTLNKDPELWEYATVAASSLAIYEGAEACNALKEALHSGSWYIRYSAAQSLAAHHMNYDDLMDIISGNDRYAREMMTYRLESYELQNSEV